MKIYLSPSNQPRNLYAYAGTNEKVQMERVAKAVLDKLTLYEVEVKLATLSRDIETRDNEAADWGANLYLAIHSNATGLAKPTASGTVCFYNPKYPITRTLSNNLVDAINAASPTKDNRYQVVIDGMAMFNRIGYHEIREPGKFGVPAVLLEVDFHDNPVIAEWIVNNINAIADAIVEALVMTYQLKKRVVVTPKPEASKGELKVERIPTKPFIVLKKDASLWAFDATSWGEIKEVKKFKKGDQIEVSDIVTNKLGGRYFRSVYSSQNNIMHGFNVVDADLIYKV